MLPSMKTMKICLVIVAVVLCLIATAAANDLAGKIRAAQCDLRIFVPVLKPSDVQWSALLYLNRNFGAEVYVGVIHPAPVFGVDIKSSTDGQMHFVTIGRGPGMADSTLADSICSGLFDGIYPDLSIFAADGEADSLTIMGILNRIRENSTIDSTSLTSFDRVFYRGRESQAADVVLDDKEIYGRYMERAKELDSLFGAFGPLQYAPNRFRWYYIVDADPGRKDTSHDFISGFDTFRMPDIIQKRLGDGPEQKNMLGRLARFRSYIRAAQKQRPFQPQQIQLLNSAYREIIWLLEKFTNGRHDPVRDALAKWARRIQHRTFLAVSEAVGIDWSGNLEIRKTPFGNVGKLILDVELTGAQKVELSYFRFHPYGKQTIVVDSISQIIQPHQKFYREYPVDLSNIDMSAHFNDSLLFSIEVVIENVSLALYIPLTEYAEETVAIEFLPGFSFLKPFSQGQITTLAQPFDWQILISKPYGSELTGDLTIITPDGIVVGTYDEHIFMPVGMTRKYVSVFLAAGRSVGFDVKTVDARLEVGGQLIAATSAKVRVVRSEIKDTRDIGFIPDVEGRLEDFLRMAQASFQPFTPHSLIRASLDAYDLIIIGQDAESYYPVLRANRDRLRQFVENGGEVLILGQGIGWPGDLFDFPLYSSRMTAFQTCSVKAPNHTILKSPYEIRTGDLNPLIKSAGVSYPAIISAGTEIISAGEHGSYLRVVKVGDGHVIYCGLPLLEMAGKLDVEAIHLFTNLLNFGHGN